MCHNLDTVKDVYERILTLTNISEEAVSMYSSTTPKHLLPTTKTRVLVTTHTSFAQKGTTLTPWEPGLIIYDECHKNVSYAKGSNFENCMATQLIKSDVPYLYGLSGTPYQDFF